MTRTMESLLRKYAKYFALGVLVISVILMTFVTYQITLAKQQFANQLITKSITQTQGELDNFFERVTHLIYTVEQQYRSGFWMGQSRKKIIVHNSSLIENFAPISSIGIADLRGYELNVIPDSLSGHWRTRRVFVDRWGFVERWNKWKLTDSLVSIHHWEDSLAVDPRERPWFKGAVQASGDIFWTNPYEYTTGPEIGITASLLLPNDMPIDPLSKIIAFDLTLNDLNRFVDDLQLTENQNIFLLTGDNSEVIALRNYSPNMGLGQIDSSLLLSPEELENQILLKVLEKEENQQAFRFDSGGKTWWGILKPYHISEDRTLNIVSVLPEEDFALEINRTLWVGIGSFFLILILAFIVVWNHNKLHRIGNILSEKNELISEQKKILFSEVHHRVKNNLALISAFLELDLFNTENPSAGKQIRKNMHRTKIIAVIQEEAYKSDKLGSIPTKNLISAIINYTKNSASEVNFSVKVEPFYININQALTLGLLLNELLELLLKQDPKVATGTISIKLTKKESHACAYIHSDHTTSTPEYYNRVLKGDIINALLQQLNAIIERSIDDGIAFKIEFELKEQKGTASSKHYKS